MAVFRVPIRLVQALNKVNYWSFTGSAIGWTATNDNGTNVCGNNDSSTGDDPMATLAYTGSLGNPAGSFQAVSGIDKNTNHRGMVHQTVTAPGTGAVLAKGRMDYYGNSTSWAAVNTSWIRLDIYDSGNTTFVANLACVSFNANQAWTTFSFSSGVGLTGGTGYTVRATMRSRTPSSNSVAVTLVVDNVILNFAPTGLGGTNPVDTTNVQLDWTTSIAGTSAPDLHGTSPYAVYRNLDSPVSTFLANSSTNSYTDSSGVGNTRYYFAIADIDTNGDTSPMSGEVNVLTRPGAPTGVGFSGVSSSSISVTWTAPTNGASSYRVERAPDSGGLPGTWEEKAAGVSSPWTDSTVTCGTTYWYRVRGTNGAGDGVYSSDANQPTSGCASISITTNGSVSFGMLGLGKSAMSTGDAEIISVDGGPVNLDIRSTYFIGVGYTWILNSTSDTNKVKWEFSNAGSSWNTFLVADSLYPFDTSVGVGETRNAYFKITIPTFTDSYEQYSTTVTVVASSP